MLLLCLQYPLDNFLKGENMEITKQILKLLGQETKPKKKLIRERRSKHMGKYFRATKAYADDRQKAPHNRRKHGMRKRK